MFLKEENRGGVVRSSLLIFALWILYSPAFADDGRFIVYSDQVRAEELERICKKVEDVLQLKLKMKFLVMDTLDPVSSCVGRPDRKILLSPGVTLGVLVHEIAHAILIDNFGESLPERLQDVDAGYAEYELVLKRGRR